jgi:uncharacterized membrane protein YhaH (DUF805 family)
MNGMNDNPGVKWLLFSSSGRTGRQAYVMSILLWLMLQGAAVALMLAFENTSKAGLLLTALALVVISIATFVSFIMLSIKRLHDMGFPGIFVLLLFVPVISFFVFIVFLFWPSAPPNDFGEYPNRPK